MAATPGLFLVGICQEELNSKMSSNSIWLIYNPLLI